MTEQEMKKLVEETIAKHSSVTDEFKRYCQDAYPTDGYTFDDKEFENVRPVLSMFKEWLDQKMMNDAIDGDINFDDMMGNTIRILEREKVMKMIREEFRLGDKLKILIFKKD